MKTKVLLILFGVSWFLGLFQLTFGQKTELYSPTGLKGSVLSIAFSPAGNLMASCDDTGTIKFWDIESGQELRTINVHSRDSDELVLSVNFSPTGKTLISGSSDGTIALWDVNTGIELKKVTLPAIWTGHAPRINSVIFSPDGRTFASSDESIFPIKLWEIGESNEIRWLRGFDNQLGFDPDLAFSPNGKILASSSGGHILLWDLESKNEELLWKLSGDVSYFRSLEFSKNGKLIAGLGNDGTVWLWDTENGENLEIFGKSVKLKEKINNCQFSVHFSLEDKMLAGTTPGCSVVFWNLATGEEIQNLIIDKNTSEIRSLSFSQDDKFIAMGSYRSIKLWSSDFRRESLILGNTLDSSIISVAFSPDKKTIAWQSMDTGVRVFDIATGETTIFDMLEATQVWSGFYKLDEKPLSPDKKFQIKLTENNKLNFYEVKTGKLLCSFINNDKDWLVQTPEGLFDGTPNAWKKLIWRFDNNTFNYAPVEAFFKEFYRPGLLQDIFAGNPIEPLTQDLSTIDIRQPSIKISSIDEKPTDSSAQIFTAKKTVKVKVEINDNTNKGRRDDFPDSSNANDVRLFRNGSLVKLWDKKTKAGNKNTSIFELTEKDGCKQVAATKETPRKAVCETDVQITVGENNFTAYGFNHDNVKSNDATASVKGSDSLKRDGTVYILSVGVNEYANSNYNLNYAVPDAEVLSNEIKNQQKRLGVYKNQEVILLKNDEATKSNILYALDRFSRGDNAIAPKNLTAELKQQLSQIHPSQPEDAIVVYFSGHGFADKDRFYLIPHDLGVTEDVETVTEKKLEALRTHSVSDEELEAKFETIDAGQFMFIIDACNSGQALETSDEKRRGPMNSRGLAQLAYEKGMYILTASESFQVARETSELGHGLLTYSLLEGMNKAEDKAQLKGDRDGNGDLFEREWFNYATELVPNLQERRYRGKPSKQEEEKSVPVAERGKRSAVQTPRVFYRREPDINQLLIAKP